MGTPFDDIYGLFLSQIDDYELFSVEEEELTSVIEDYLVNGIMNLVEAPEYLMDIDLENKSFNSELTSLEKVLVAKCMVLEWVNTKRNSAELMRKAIGDRDYKAIQGTTYLKELNNLEVSIRNEIRKTIIRYSYRTTVIEGFGS